MHEVSQTSDVFSMTSSVKEAHSQFKNYISLHEKKKNANKMSHVRNRHFLKCMLVVTLSTLVLADPNICSKSVLSLVSVVVSQWTHS